MIKGWSKFKITRDALRQVSFLLLQRLSTVLASVYFDHYEVLLFCSTFSLVFFGALRVSEFAASKARSVTPLLASDVVLLRDSASLCNAHSKTDQYGQGTWMSISAIDH